MPNYTFRSKSTGEETDETMTISQMEERLASNPDLEVVIRPVAYSASGRLTFRVSEGYKDVLRTIKKNNPGSTINV